MNRRSFLKAAIIGTAAISVPLMAMPIHKGLYEADGVTATRDLSEQALEDCLVAISDIIDKPENNLYEDIARLYGRS